MDQETLNKFEELNKKLDQIYRSAEKTRKYFLWMLIISLAVIVLPLIGLAFAIPQFINIYTNAGLGL
jgi:type II secretory pathway component PulF